MIRASRPALVAATLLALTVAGCNSGGVEAPGTIKLEGDRDSVRAQMINPTAAKEDASNPDKKSKGTLSPGGKGAPTP